MLAECRTDPTSRLPGLATGEFFVRSEGDVGFVKVAWPLMQTKQMAEAEIVQAARRRA
jgi:hypothetical protein